MTVNTKSAYTDIQIIAWLRGLYTIALADGHYDPQERDLIAQLTHDLADIDDIDSLQPIEPPELAAKLGKDAETAENFLRTAVLVAVADGIYSTPEYDLLHRFSDALEIQIDALKSLENTLYKPENSTGDISERERAKFNADVLHPVKEWLDEMEIKDSRLARFICKVIPPQCPFERDINLFGRKVAHIPPLCKLNPLYEQFTTLRFRSLSYLADDLGEDISEYI
jgi:tellurite resistance protein